MHTGREYTLSSGNRQISVRMQSVKKKIMENTVRDAVSVKLSGSRKTRFIDLGLIDYQQAWAFQNERMEEILRAKTANRHASSEERISTPNYLIFCEHPHVYTLGRNGKPSHLLADVDLLQRINASFVHTNRGGDITYHGPGQLVGYPIFDLENFFTDIHRYMRTLEEAIIRTLKYFGIEAGRIEGLTGVWVNCTSPARARKICAMGVRTSRWVTQHGFALNVNTDLRYFNYIVPCGIQDKAVTSMERELNRKVDMHEVVDVLRKHLEHVFELEWV
jgi:lipoyl(octanoyl) transferase